jgi:hypothetical protein
MRWQQNAQQIDGEVLELLRNRVYSLQLVPVAFSLASIALQSVTHDGLSFLPHPSKFTFSKVVDGIPVATIYIFIYL